MSDRLADELDTIKERARWKSIPIGDGKWVAGLDSAGDVPRLLAAVETALRRHRKSDEPVVTRNVCARHASFTGHPSISAATWRDAVEACADCLKTAHYVCVTCHHECPDDDEWPCQEYRAIEAALTAAPERS